jgi:hypothetical protein
MTPTDRPETIPEILTPKMETVGDGVRLAAGIAAGSAVGVPLEMVAGKILNTAEHSLYAGRDADFILESLGGGTVAVSAFLAAVVICVVTAKALRPREAAPPASEIQPGGIV